ncbi:tyrosine-type recombinase/integrase [Vibrio vulnificus]|nr:tyrosine-type recombinase/integrase [Vibrio vulnificus]
MSLISLYNRDINLQYSSLNETEGLCLTGVAIVSGTVVLNKNMQVLPCISGFLCHQQLNQRSSRTTSVTYGRNLLYCLSYLSSRDEFKHCRLDEAFLTVSRSVLEEYFSFLRIQGLKSSTIRNRDACIKSFFNDYLSKPVAGDYFRKDNPYGENGLISPSPKQRIVQPCELYELEAMMRMSSSERERLLLQFMFDSGVRRSEVGRVTLADIHESENFTRTVSWGRETKFDLPSGYLPLRISGSKGRAGQIKPRITMLSASTFRRIKAYHSSPLYIQYARKYDHRRKPETTPAFFNSVGKPINARTIDKLLLKLSNKAIASGAICKPISPHKLRHGYAYEVLKSKDLGDNYLDRLVNVSKTLGHSSIKITQDTYTRIPIDIYEKLTERDSKATSKSERMAMLSKNTKVKIHIGDRK